MNKYHSIIILFIAVIFSSCVKQPEASFVTDLSEYSAGEIVHLTNTSSDANSYIWMMPGGQIVRTTNADYQIDPNFGFGTLTFILNASLDGRKASSFTRTVDVIPSSVFSVDSSNFSYSPNSILSKPYLNNRWWIYATLEYHHPNVYLQQQGLDGPGTASLSIVLPGSTTPIAGTYLLKSNDTLNSGEAYIRIGRRWWEDNYENFISISGEMNLEITNGKVHAIFSHIDASHTDRWSSTSPLPNVKISGDITCH